MLFHDNERGRCGRRVRRIVVIGAGIVGNSVAYHLTQLGETDITLIDKGPLPNPGGSTGHASNFIFPVDHSKEMTALTVESMRQYVELDVFTKSGGIEIARTQERMQELTRRMASAKAWGVEPVSMLTPAEVSELVPFINEQLMIGGFFTPGAGVVDSLRAGTIMLRERAVQAGIRVMANTEVLGIDVEHGRVRCVGTNHGDLDVDVVVICCGVWSPVIAAKAGASIPLTPMVHQMIDIGPAPRFADAKGMIEYPIVRDMDENMYERQEGTGLEIGSYAHRPIVVDPREIPSLEESALTPTELPFTQDDFDPQMEIALELMPEIVGDETVGVKYAINGLLSVTGDGMPILGETPEVRGLWASAAVWIKEGPGVGKTVAELIVHGESEIDVYGSNAARFYGCQRATGHVVARASEGFNKMYGIVHPGEQWESDRRVRVAPFYERERELGAVFFETAGWERPQWYESNAGLLEEYGDRVSRREAEWESRWWSPIINAEHLAMRDRAAMIDLTAFAIFDVTGPAALDVVQRVAMRQMDVAVGRVVYTPLLTPGGGFKQDLTIMRLGDDVFRVVTGGAYGMSDLKWFADYLPDDGSAQLHDETNAWCTLGLWGPRARAILHRAHERRRVTHEGFAFATCKTIEVGTIPVLASRISYVGDLGWELYALIEQGARLWDIVVEAGAAARPDPGRDRRVRDHRAPGEVLPRLWRRARKRVQRRRSRDGVGQGQRPGLHRQGRARAPPRVRAGRGHVLADRRRPHVRVGGQAVHARRRAGPDPRRRVAGRRQGPTLLRHQRRRRAVDRQAHPDDLPAARARGRRQRAGGRVHGRALPGHRRGSWADAPV